MSRSLSNLLDYYLLQVVHTNPTSVDQNWVLLEESAARRASLTAGRRPRVSFGASGKRADERTSCRLPAQLRLDGDLSRQAGTPIAFEGKDYFLGEDRVLAHYATGTSSYIW
ncbi:hypothetical protein PPTG_23900 [Phytophthora nicotianae INRA-310]|uniref:Uncharacterized protein n=1 Tax=Phytophthora nicotianae (strain INRA-310) TaxID=761204 RepID=W2PNK7_PHYN3|nr:hypothetical protein PPTG_23900 [Phytophthora nicotianae INRA-310]ETN02578.1 hypothetical protein PPTG_23900 [Phytophthora nicotianae INRA-310]